MRQIDKEEKTKAAIRVIAAIFDAFHFDLNRFKRPKIVQQVRTRTRLNKSNKLTPITLICYFLKIYPFLKQIWLFPLNLFLQLCPYSYLP